MGLTTLGKIIVFHIHRVEHPLIEQTTLRLTQSVCWVSEHPMTSQVGI